MSSSGSSDTTKDVPTNHTVSYFLRRETRLSAKERAEEETANNDYKKAGLVKQINLYLYSVSYNQNCFAAEKLYKK